MLKLFQVETLKLFKDKVLLLGLTAMAGAPIMVALIFLFGKADMVKRGVWTANSFMGQSQQMLVLLMGPMMVAIIGTYLMNAEYRQRTLKSLLPLPTSLPKIFGAKILSGTISVILGVAIAGLFAIICTLLFGLTSWQQLWPFIWGTMKTHLLIAFLLLALLVLAIVITLISKNFVFPLGLAMVCQVGGLLAVQSEKGQYFWTALPLMVLTKYQRTQTIPFKWVVASMVYLVIFTIVGLLWAKFNPRPE